MKQKLSLLQQVLIEEKRRQLKIFKAEYNPKILHTVQMRALLPNITWKPKQADFINALQFVKWYLGGYKSGKTFTGVALDAWFAFINRPYPGMLVHPTMDGNQLTIIPTIEEICELNHIEFDIKKLNTKFKVIFVFGKKKADWGTMYLASGDVPKSLKGPKLAWAHVDEPLVMKKEIVGIMMSRLAEVRGKLRTLMFTGTPEPEHMQWGFDIVDKEFEDTEQRFITTVSTREVAEYLAPGYIEELEKSHPANWIETFVDGKYRNLSQGKVYSGFDKRKNVRAAEECRGFAVRPDNELVLGFDFNVNQMSAALIRLSGTYKIQVKEFRIQSTSDTEELCTLVINRLRLEGQLIMREDGKWWTRYNRSIIITGDASGKALSSKSKKSDYMIIMECFNAEKIIFTISVPDANPAVRDRVNHVNTQCKTETYIISAGCPITIRDRELTSWKLGADGFAIDKSKKELTHLSDAADYAIYNTQMLTQTAGSAGVRATRRMGRS